MTSVTIAATQFKAQCLEVLDDIADRKVDEVVITKHGRPVGVLKPMPDEAVPSLFGALASQTSVKDGVDLTAPTMNEPTDAERGRLHG